MSDIDAIKRLAPESHRIQRAKQSNRQRDQSRNGSEDQFRQIHRERNKDSDVEDTLITADPGDGDPGDDQTNSDAGEVLDSNRKHRRAANSGDPGQVGRNTDITA